MSSNCSHYKISNDHSLKEKKLIWMEKRMEQRREKRTKVGDKVALNDACDANYCNRTTMLWHHQRRKSKLRTGKIWMILSLWEMQEKGQSDIRKRFKSSMSCWRCEWKGRKGLKSLLLREQGPLNRKMSSCRKS
jgi:hypothetical protein